MSEVIAQREYLNTDGIPVIVRWFKPEPAPDGDWKSAWSVQFGDEPPSEERSAFGIDSMQALNHALMLSEVALKKLHPPLLWLNNRDLGLPSFDAQNALRMRHPLWQPVISLLRSEWDPMAACVDETVYIGAFSTLIAMIEGELPNLAGYLAAIRSETFKLPPNPDSDMAIAAKLMSLRSR